MWKGKVLDCIISNLWNFCQCMLTKEMTSLEKLNSLFICRFCPIKLVSVEVIIM